MPLQLHELTDLDNQIIGLNQNFDSAQAGGRAITVDDIVDSILTLLPLFKSATIRIKPDADLGAIVDQLGKLHAITSKAKTGQEIIDPQDVITLVTSMINLIESTSPPPVPPVPERKQVLKK